MINRDMITIQNLLLLGLLLLGGVAFAQTPTEQGVNAQNEQMLQQIQQLQKVQAKQQQVMQQRQQLGQLQLQAQPTPFSSVAKIQPTTQLQEQSNLSGGAEISKIKNEQMTPADTFQYPFQQSQVKDSQQLKQIGNKAFAGAVRNVLPMSPGQVHRLKQIYHAAQFAASVPAGTPPKPTATSIYINLSPGASPPAIRLTQGFVTSLLFLDATGAPWPIAAYDLGDPRSFNIAWDKKDNLLMIQAKTLYTYGNLAVRLRGLNTPVMLTLVPGQQIVDYRVDITVPGYGPDAQALPIDTGLPDQATPVLLSVLDGIPPKGSRKLTVDKGVGQAWEVRGKMYLRTRYTLLSPGWLATMASADGTTAYQLQKTPMLLISKNGQIVHVKIGGF